MGVPQGAIPAHDRMKGVAGNIKAPFKHRRAINELMVFLGHAPWGAFHEPGQYLRGMRAQLRMSQEQLALRAKVPQAHIARLEAGKIDARLSTWRRLFDAMECRLLVLPHPRRRPGDVLSEREDGNNFTIGNTHNPWSTRNRRHAWAGP